MTPNKTAAEFRDEWIQRHYVTANSLAANTLEVVIQSAMDQAAQVEREELDKLIEIEIGKIKEMYPRLKRAGKYDNIEALAGTEDGLKLAAHLIRQRGKD